jgi:hypothetical protein
MTRFYIINIPVLYFLLLSTCLSGQEVAPLIQPSPQEPVEQGIVLPENNIEQGNFKGFVEESTQLSNTPPGEKVYLHFDRPSYMQGDTIWFKAYSWFGYEQVPDTLSGVLYVDLLNPDGGVELKRKLLIQNGTSVGEFSPGKGISPGKYTIRAYTRWMQNENTGEPFYQAVTINAINQNFHVDCSPLIIKQADGDSLKAVFRFYEIDPMGNLKNDFSHKVNYTVKIGDRMLKMDQSVASNASEQVFRCRLPGIGENDSMAVMNLSINDERLSFEKQFHIPLKEEISLQFFPEGGKLVSGLESKVAFKSIGADGLSREVKGVIKDETGEVMTSFESSHKGMGAFFLTPQPRKEYSAFVDFNHRRFQFKLPQAMEQGCVMSVSYLEGESAHLLNIKYSPSMANTRMHVAGSSYGKIKFVSTFSITSDSSAIKIPEKLFHEGVSMITLLDSVYRPESERLFYVDRGQRFKVEVIPDSSCYSARSKVTLLVKTTGQDGEAVSASLSLAVIDKEQVINQGIISGISAYKLLESELKGTIEDAGFYFKDDSCVNRDALDLLLLTQGYRRFLPVSSNPDQIKYQPERSFDIMGKVSLRGNGARDKNFNYSNLGLTLLCPSQHAYFDQTRPDSLGQFSFQIPLQTGKPLSLLKAHYPTGKLNRDKIPGEKVFRGDILLDETATPSLRFTPPLPSPVNTTAPAIDFVRQLQAVKKTEVSKISNGVAWHLNLDEVTVKGKDKNWYTHFESEAIKIADMDSIDPTGKKYENIYDLLIRDFGAQKIIIPGVGLETILLPCISIGPSEYYPIYIMNGQIYCNAGEDSLRLYTYLNMLASIKVNEVKKLMVLPPGNIANYYADSKILFGVPSIKQSLVVIETYFNHNFYRGDPDGIKTFILDGLDAPRLFYSPRYEGPNRNNPIFDGRATLYWNPTVRTDQNGQAKVEFYTGDRRTWLEVIVNGIEVGNGFTGQGQIEINSTLQDSKK